MISDRTSAEGKKDWCPVIGDQFGSESFTVNLYALVRPKHKAKWPPAVAADA